jgi:glycosyltransferase involved in cell wall biosynthesis
MSADLVAIMIPAYQEEATIGSVVARCRAALPQASVLVIDDGSADQTGLIAANSGAEVLRNARNLGKGACLARGLAHALSRGAAWIVTLDGDGQHRPEDLPRLLACARRWPNRIVIGSRLGGAANAPLARRAANRVADFWISWASGWPVEDTQSGMRVYPAEVLRRIGPERPLPGRFAYESALLIDAGIPGIRTVSVPVPRIHEPTASRPSHFRPVKDIARIVRIVAARLMRRLFYPRGLWRALAWEADRG